MDLKLKGRKVAITGASEGIGRALALGFAQEGACVAGCARSESRLAALATEIDGDGHFFTTVDLSEIAGVQTFHDRVMEAFGGLDILVNNAGAILSLGNFFDVADAGWRDSFELNLMSAVRLTQLFIPSLKNSGSPAIVNISSVAAHRPGELFPHYNAMKAALSNWTVSLAITLAPEKIRVNSVSPGPVWSRSWEQEAEQTAKEAGKDPHDMAEEIRSQVAKGVLLGRMGTPKEVAGLVMFLASEQGSFITGANFDVDGGRA